MNHSNFYRQFEDRHRGDRSLIKGRLKVYLDFILPLRGLQETFKALDLGCGRGEWLELLQDQGIDAIGIDLDPGMLSACKERGLNTEEGDAIAALQTLPSNSISLVTAFHVAEHLPFDDLLTLVTEAHRVLTPGGLLILETPNPENLVVAAHNFYVDPTHQRPLPPVLLDFTTEYGGFERSRILRLQENEALSRSDAPGFWDVLSGASPDYSIIAQKAGPTSLMESIDDPFHADQGLKPETIALRYDHQISHQLESIDHVVATADDRTIKAEGRLEALEAHLEQIGQQLASVDHRTIKAEGRLEALEAHDPALELSIKSIEDRIKIEKRLAIAERLLEESVANLTSLHKRIERYEQETCHYQKEVAALEMKTIESREALESHQSRIKELMLQCESVQNQALEWHDQIYKIQGSISWRVTAPLRWLRAAILWTDGLLKSVLEGILFLVLAILLVPLSPLLVIAVPWILKKPRLRKEIGEKVKHIPPLRRILKFAVRIISRDHPSPDAVYVANTSPNKKPTKVVSDMNNGAGLEKTRPALGRLSQQIHGMLKGEE